MLHINRFHLYSILLNICIDQTISRSYILLPFIGPTPFRTYLSSTLLTSYILLCLILDRIFLPILVFDSRSAIYQVFQLEFSSAINI